MTLAPLFVSEASLEETTLRIDPRPVHLAMLGAAISVVLLGLLVRSARRRPGALVEPMLLPLAMVPSSVFTALYVLRNMPYFTLFRVTDTRAASSLFRGAIHVDAAAAAIGVGAMVSTALILALRTDGQLRLLAMAAPTLLVSGLLLGAAMHAASLIEVGSVPFYRASGQTQLHVGRERDVAVTLMRPPGRRWLFWTEDGPQPVEERTLARWTHVDRVHVHATSAGPIPFTAEARRGPVTLTTQLSATAFPELAAPSFPLRVGDRSVYRVRARSSGGALLYFIPLSGTDTQQDVTVEIVGTRIREGLRTFVIAVGREGAVREVEVVALAGQTRLYDPHRGTIGGSVTAFDGVTPMTIEGSAPSTTGTIATALVALFTVGLVILPDGSRSSSYALVSAMRGPEGAPEACTLSAP